MRKLLSLRSSLLFAIGIFALGFFVIFGLFDTKPARAANGDVVITVQNELGAAVLGTTLTVACTGGANQAITDGGAGDNDAANDGTITVLSTAIDNEAANCDAEEAFITDTVALDGYVTENTSLTNYTLLAQNNATTTLDFSHKVAIKDELNVALTGAAATGGANDTACTISTSFAYCPIPLADDNVLDATTAYAITKDGYVTAVPFLSASRGSAAAVQSLLTMTGANGLDFSHKFVMVNELGAAITVTSATAGSASTACTISTSTVYCPILLAGDNTAASGLVAAKDGYVTTTAADVPLASNRTANTDAQGVTTLTTTNGLDFAAKATVVLINTANVLTGATVTAGNSGLVSCAESGTTGTYYCAVPLADTDTTITSVLSTYTTAINNFADRTAATDAQQAITIQMNTTGGGGGGGGGGGSSNNTTNTTTTTTNTTTTTTTTTTETINIVDRINGEKDMVFAQTNPESYFINSGTDSTLGLGSGERGAAVSSFKEAYGKSPATAADWTDILNIANGRWPITVNKAVEARAYTNFKLVYGRNADMKNSTDVNALKMMGYGVRGTVARDMATERASIARFKAVFGHNPATAREWNIMRAIAYSGVVK